jgi:hypothetical protein
MKTKMKLSIALALLALSTFNSQLSTAFADVTFNVTPSAVSNTYNGTITLQIGGLTNKTVVIQKFLDLNTNGIIDGGDLLVQQFTLQDGTNFVIGGVINFDVPGDLNATTGTITATLNFQNGDFVQNIVGNYLYELSSPGGHFAPLTNQFAVTNFPFPQMFTGNVVSNSTSTTLPNAIVLLFPPPRPGHSGPGGSPLAGVVANNAGSYTVQVPPGTYMPVAFESNYVANMNTAPLLTLAASQTITTNLTLANATTSISGNVVDADNSSIGLPGVMVPAQSTDGLIAITFTDTNGNFNVPVTAGTWGLKADDTTLIIHGYVRLQNGTNVNAGQTGVTLAYPKGTALIYGSVQDNLGNPMVGIDVYAYDNNDNLYESDGYTGTNGNYVIAVLGGLGSGDPWGVEVSSDNITNYVFSKPFQNGGTNISANTAVQANIIAILATNHITGNVKANGTNIVGVGVSASMTTNGANFFQNADTDANGNYSLNVGNGSWTVGVYCNGGSDSLDNILGPGNYQCPDNQTAVINNNNATNNFTVQPCGGISIITTSLPAGEVGVYYDQTLQASSCNIGAYNWILIGGSLPSGLTLGSNGEIYGTNSASGTYTFTVQVTDSGSLTTNGQFSIGVSNAVQITTTSLPNGTDGSAYSQPLQVTGGQPPYIWSVYSGSLPANLTLTTNGLLSGTLATNGTFDFTVEVADSLDGISDQSLSLTITNGAPVPDVLAYYVTKLEAFLQLDATNIVLNANAGPFNAFLGIIQSSLGMVPIATVTLPTGAVKGLPWGSSAIEIRSQESFPSQASFDAAYPPGNYDFALYGLHDGLRFPVLSMPPPVYPDPPHVSNFAAAQSLNPLAAFTLQWDAIPGGTTDDTLWVVITDTNGNPVFSTPYPPMDLAGSLKGTATSVVIPTNTFQFGHAYVGTITFFRTTSVNTTDYPGAVGVTVVGVQTWFPLAMASALPVLSQPTKLSSTQFSFQLSGFAGQDYTILASTNVSLPMSNWFPVLTTNLSTNPAFIEDNQATNQQRFYRVKVGL